jgi:hypothetical protein
MQITLKHICWIFIIILILLIFVKYNCNQIDRFQAGAGIRSWFNEKILGRNQAKSAPLSRADQVAVSGPTDAMLTDKSEINANKYHDLEYKVNGIVHRVKRLEDSLSNINKEMLSQPALNSVSAPPQPVRPPPQRRAPPPAPPPPQQRRALPPPPRDQVKMRREPVAANADDGRGDLLSEIKHGAALRPVNIRRRDPELRNAGDGGHDNFIRSRLAGRRGMIAGSDFYNNGANDNNGNNGGNDDWLDD